MNEILNVREKVYSNESISQKEFFTYSSYNQTFKPNDEIQISIQNQDLYVLPHESYLNFQGIIRNISPNGPTTVKTGPIDVRISTELKTPSPDNTQADCLLGQADCTD